jgi:hypothetical protein
MEYSVLPGTTGQLTTPSTRTVLVNVNEAMARLPIPPVMASVMIVKHYKLKIEGVFRESMHSSNISKNLPKNFFSLD